MSGSGAEVSRDELSATVAARHELGKEYEPALVDALAERVEQAIQARVEAQMAQSAQVPQHSTGAPSSVLPWGGRVAVAATSLGVAIPVTAIAGSAAGFGGILISWVGIVLVNVAAAMGPRQSRYR
jgi:hypothetical protein